MPHGPALLVVGHPGHELRVHGWLEANRPVVMVLTDGSGHTGVSRLASTATLLQRAGATPGSIFGRLTDTDLYRVLLDQNTTLVCDRAAEIADAIDRHQINVVAGDDAEGYNPTHDVCRLIVDAAVSIAQAGRDQPLANLAFALMERPDQSAQPRATSSQFLLDDGALQRKLDAAACYPEMAAEVAAAREAWGDAAFREETFRHVAPDTSWSPGDEPPFYERHGERRVASGLYTEVIRYDRHIRPLAFALTARAKLQTQ